MGPSNCKFDKFWEGFVDIAPHSVNQIPQKHFVRKWTFSKLTVENLTKFGMYR